jgi:hypothetical protein
MRNYVKQVGCTMLVLTFALLAAPMAQADNDSFAAAVRALGLDRPDDSMIRLGRSACRMLQPRLRRQTMDVEAYIARSANLEPSSVPPPGRDLFPGDGKAHEFLVLSVDNLCPNLAYRLSE